MGTDVADRPGRRRLLIVLTAMVASVLALASCGDGGPDSDADPQISAVFERDAQLPTVRLGVGGWATARLNAAVAEQLIERRLGYPVEPVDVLDFRIAFQELERGVDLHAVLEVWPNSLSERELVYLEQNRVDSLGELGVVGRIGWFVPAFTSEQLEVTTWRDLTDPAIAEAFSLSGTGAGRFLGIDPSYEQYDQAIADELGLNFEVEFSGSESATRQEVENALAAQAPILIYWWVPTELAVTAKLVEVELPEWTQECETARLAGQPAGCGYRPERLLKIGSPGLEEMAPEVRSFLQAFSLSNEDHDYMLARVANGESFALAASSWIAANETVWAAWLDET